MIELWQWWYSDQDVATTYYDDDREQKSRLPPPTYMMELYRKYAEHPDVQPASVRGILPCSGQLGFLTHFLEWKTLITFDKVLFPPLNKQGYKIHPG